MTTKPEVPVQDAHELPVYSSELRALLEAKLHDAWAELSLTMDPVDSAFNFDGLRWELKVVYARGHASSIHRSYIYVGGTHVVGTGETAPLANAHAIEALRDKLAKEEPPPETFPERALREFKQMFPDPGVSYAPTREFEHQGTAYRLRAEPLPRLKDSFNQPWRVEIGQPSTQRYWHADGDDCLTAFNNALALMPRRVQDDTPKASALVTGLPGGPDWKNKPWFQDADGTNIHDELEERLKKAGVDVRMATGWLCEAIDMEKKASAAGDEACVVEGSTGSTWAMRVEREHSTWAFQLTRRGAGGRSWRALGVTYWQAFWNAAEAVGKDSDLPFSDNEITGTIERHCKRHSGTNRLTPGAKHMLEEAGVNLEIAADWMKCAAEMYPVAVETGGKRSQACGWSLAVWRSGDEWQFTIERSQVSVVAKDRGYWAAFWAVAVKVGKVSQAYTGVGLATATDKTVAVTMAVDKAAGEPVSVEDIAEAPKAVVWTYTMPGRDTRSIDPDVIMEMFKPPPAPLRPDEARRLGQQFLAVFLELGPAPEGRETIRAIRVGEYTVRLSVYLDGDVSADIHRSGKGVLGKSYASCGTQAERIAYAKEEAVMKAVQELTSGYKPPELSSSAEEHEPDLWNEVPTPHEPPKEEDWPASQHGGYKWLG